MTPTPIASHFINGSYIEDTDGEIIDVIYPATGEKIAQVHSATPAIVEAAISSARSAQKAWAATPGTERGRILRRAADIMRERNRELSILETFDTGKPLQETLYVDATSAREALEYFGGLAGSLTGEHIPLGQDFAYTIREPLGVCLGIGAWNYPTQIAAWKGAPALACGNTMVFKPSETTPLCALKVAEILHEAGLPAGCYNVIQGLREASAQMVKDTRIAKISLTGSVPTGRKVYEAAAKNLKHATMELGGKSPLVIFDDADLEDAVGGAMLGNMYSSGQVCSNGTRVFVQSGLYERFLERFAERARAIKLGDPMDEDIQMGPMVSKAQMEKVLSYIEIGKAEGARLVAGGRKADSAQLTDGFYIEPTVFADVTDNMRIAQEEIFGPVVTLMPFETEAEVLQMANNVKYGLSATLW
ncbi:MAG: betaine-aldehyde dehydrogenase, partial [Pseudomonadota bacterium]